ncbi:SDR family oxidoreductase [Symbiobacterium thermophilum]|uniref:SDR family oxidoreductase n=1 Tax=Symbiobacterium thermophilum TaxID=2734 RepID=UPI0035C6E48E
MDFGLQGRVAWVTAASKGLGFASAMALAREGCDLAICSRNGEAIGAAAERIRQETGRRVLALAADVTRREDLERFITAAMDEYGRVDVVVSNTGGPPPGGFLDFDDAAWEAAFHSLLMPAIRLTRAAIPSMRERGFGRLIYITSSGVKEPIPNLILSNALRAALTNMMKTLAREVAAFGITANTVAPGRIHTDRVDSLDQGEAARTGRTIEEVRRAQEARIPAGRYGRPAEFGQVVAFLASEQAGYITGSAIHVDGGMTVSL